MKNKLSRHISTLVTRKRAEQTGENYNHYLPMVMNKKVAGSISAQMSRILANVLVIFDK
jgi:hypothetical protein